MKTPGSHGQKCDRRPFQPQPVVAAEVAPTGVTEGGSLGSSSAAALRVTFSGKFESLGGIFEALPGQQMNGKKL